MVGGLPADPQLQQNNTAGLVRVLHMICMTKVPCMCSLSTLSDCVGAMYAVLLHTALLQARL